MRKSNALRNQKESCLPSFAYSSTVFFSPTLKPSVLDATRSSSAAEAILVAWRESGTETEMCDELLMVGQQQHLASTNTQPRQPDSHECNSHSVLVNRGSKQ